MSKTTMRRQFLRGAGGFILGLPFLESLTGKSASAGDPPFAANPRFVAMMTRQGGTWGSNMYPGDAAAPSTLDLYPGHTAHHGVLNPTTEGSTASLSRVLSAPADKLTPALAAKLNCLRGLDIPYYLSHNWGGVMGNLAAGGTPGPAARQTIDQVMAYSSSFYPDLQNIRLRSMQIGSAFSGGMSYGYADPQNQTGAIEAVPSSQSSIQLFNQIFVPESTEPQRPLVVDRVIENYRRLSSGSFGHASRLSATDRTRLDDHMDRLYDLEMRLNAVASCGDVPTPTQDALGLPPDGNGPGNIDALREYYELYNDVIVAAFMCGTSRIASIMAWERFSDAPGIGDWHEDIAHQSVQPDGFAQGVMADSKRNFFEYVFLDLARKLDVVEANDKTYLDNSLLFWTEECGDITHESLSYPVITAGSAAGFLNTGLYVDYRNRNNMNALGNYTPIYSERRPGILYSQWLATALQAVGVPASEWEQPGEKGFLEPFREANSQDIWSDAMFDDASDVLPLLRA